VFVTVLNGEAIPVIQTRIADADLEHLDIITLGADKVFIQSISEMDVMTVITRAQGFFNLFFPTRCDGIWMWWPMTMEHGCVFKIFLFMLGMRLSLSCVCLIVEDFYGWT